MHNFTNITFHIKMLSEITVGVKTQIFGQSACPQNCMINDFQANTCFSTEKLKTHRSNYTLSFLD